MIAQTKTCTAAEVAQQKSWNFSTIFFALAIYAITVLCRGADALMCRSAYCARTFYDDCSRPIQESDVHCDKTALFCLRRTDGETGEITAGCSEAQPPTLGCRRSDLARPKLELCYCNTDLCNTKYVTALLANSNRAERSRDNNLAFSLVIVVSVWLLIGRMTDGDVTLSGN